MKRRQQAGFSLVELLVAVTLLALFAGGLLQLARGLLRGVHLLEVASEAQQAARIGVQLIVRELRGSGFAPHAPLRPALSAAARDRVSLVSDLNGDGDSDDANERVEYRFDATRRALMRALGAASPQPMLMDVDGLDFTYRDEGGTPIPLTAEAVGPADLARIRRVDVQLVVRIQVVDAGGATAAVSRQTGTAFLRNG